MTTQDIADLFSAASATPDTLGHAQAIPAGGSFSEHSNLALVIPAALGVFVMSAVWPGRFANLGSVTVS